MRVRRSRQYAFIVFAAAAVAAAIAGRSRSIPGPWPVVASPNCDERPQGSQISCIVLHATAIPTLDKTVAWFLDPHSRVSSHFVIDKDGRVVQVVPLDKRAWHAGVAEFHGRSDVNDFSVGIELVNRNDGNDPYPDAQVRSAAEVVRFVRGRYPVPLESIVSHAQIARPAGRKTDPGGLDLARIVSLCKKPATGP